MAEESYDKILFRKDRFPAEQSPTLPDDLRWAIGEPEYITGGVGGGQSTVSSIILAGNDTFRSSDPDGSAAGPNAPQKPQVPTPTIVGVVSSEVFQTMEGVSKADVWIGVEGMEGVEYEVLVTPA